MAPLAPRTSSGASSKTQAAARTSTGHLIQVSLRFAEPPGVSCVCLQVPDGLATEYSRVIAAHGDSVLIEVYMKKEIGDMIGYRKNTTDRFVYNAGDAAADPPRPPSLSLLPPLFDPDFTGLMRRGEDELVLAELMPVQVPSEPDTPTTPELLRVAMLGLFRHGEWSVKSLQIRLRDDNEVCAWERARLSWNAVIPVGDRLLCWVDLKWLVVVLCDDVFEETPMLQFVRLPTEKENWKGPRSNRNVCATAGGDALKYVNVFPRCCCGEAGDASCSRSRHAYTIHTWTMRLDGGTMEWVLDSVVDATELWALDAYKGLPCLPLGHPVVSMDDPDLICFWLHEPQSPDIDDTLSSCHYTYGPKDMLMVNTRSKTIHSVSPHEDGFIRRSDGPVPSRVSSFFNSYRSDGTLAGQRQNKGTEKRPPPAIVDEQLIRAAKRQRASITTNPTLQPAASFDETTAQASEIFFEAFQEILSFGLDQDKLIKAYSILSRDNCRRFRSFIRLPKNVRKDWLSMEIMQARED